MRTALAAGDITIAANYFSEDTIEACNQQFTGLDFHLEQMSRRNEFDGLQLGCPAGSFC
jgi:hypothetical protein